MLFNSLTFLVFFAIVMIVHALPLRWHWRKFNLLIFSYLFYMAWNPPFVILLWISTVVDWFLGKAIAQTDSVAKKRWLLVGSLLVNLGMLSFFKYGEFLVKSFAGMMAQVGVDYVPPEMDIVLPVGISFYTFQTLSYTLDIYRGKMKPWNSFLDYAMYVTFFPQLVAGPIVRAVDFLDQCATPRRASSAQLSWGLTLLAIGLFEKVVIADGLLAPISEKLYDASGGPQFLDAWLGTFAFAGQIFCDFAGYSTCAIGVAMCLGFGIMDNFRFPYAAVGFSDFWRRWHISLSSWLRDYLYIPLGGNKHVSRFVFVHPLLLGVCVGGLFIGNVWISVGAGGLYLLFLILHRGVLNNLMLTMVIGGLWHGAAWTFVVWGALHGFYLLAERVIKRIVPASPLWSKPPVQLLLAIGTFLAICVTWVFFRAKSFDSAFGIVGSMLGRVPDGQRSLLTPTDMIIAGYVTVGLLTVHWLMRKTTLEDVANRTPWWLRATLVAVMITLTVMMPGEDRAFIYFQF